MIKALDSLNPDLIRMISEKSETHDFPAGYKILTAGQYFKFVPVVLDGLLKVFTRYEDKELLLYYVQKDETCMLSFTALFDNSPCQVYAVAEEDTKAMLVPISVLEDLKTQYPEINAFIFKQFNRRYSELINTINQLMYDKLDQRLIKYLGEKSKLKKENPVKISHRQIAKELGTSREVISRITKKLDFDGLINQQNNSIEIINL